MEYGAHLPLIGFQGEPFSLEGLIAYTRTAERLGFQTLCANDHLVFPRPWLDGPTALAAVLPFSGGMTLATTVALPVVRGPVQLAKTLAAIDLLSGGRLIVGVGPGSSPHDYAIADIPFEERWGRLDESVECLRSLFKKGSPSFQGKFYSTEGLKLEPYPAQAFSPPIWLGSWGSPAGLRRTARLADGWLASAYNITPESFRDALSRLGTYLRRRGVDPDSFPNAIATMLLFITEDRYRAKRMLEEVICPAMSRSPDELAPRILVGPAEECAEKIVAYQTAGAERIFVWPVGDEGSQLELFWERVVPLVTGLDKTNPIPDEE